MLMTYESRAEVIISQVSGKFSVFLGNERVETDLYLQCDVYRNTYLSYFSETTKRFGRAENRLTHTRQGLVVPMASCTRNAVSVSKLDLAKVVFSGEHTTVFPEL